MLERLNISDGVVLEYELFVEKNKVGLDRVVTSMKGESEVGSAKKEVSSRSSAVKKELTRSSKLEDSQHSET